MNTFMSNLYRLYQTHFIELHFVNTDDPVIGISFSKRPAVINYIPFVFTGNL